MRRRLSRRLLRTFSPALLLLVGLTSPPPAAASDWGAVAAAIGREGTLTDRVYKVSFPRTDLRVTVDGVPIRTGLALGGWAAFIQEGDATVVDGDLVLLPQEIRPVASTLLAGGLEVTALHNHLVLETPHVMYLHFFGRGEATALARGLNAAIAKTATPPPGGPSPEPTATPEWARMVEQSVGYRGSLKGGVLAVGIPRADPIHEHGSRLAPTMGMANAFVFQETDTGQVATTGDFVLTGDEVTPVLGELQAGGIILTALHNHLIRSTPTLYFMHFWGVGTPSQIGETLKRALTHVKIRQG